MKSRFLSSNLPNIFCRFFSTRLETILVFLKLPKTVFAAFSQIARIGLFIFLSALNILLVTIVVYRMISARRTVKAHGLYEACVPPLCRACRRQTLSVGFRACRCGGHRYPLLSRLVPEIGVNRVVFHRFPLLSASQHDEWRRRLRVVRDAARRDSTGETQPIGGLWCVPIDPDLSRFDLIAIGNPTANIPHRNPQSQATVSYVLHI